MTAFERLTGTSDLVTGIRFILVTTGWFLAFCWLVFVDAYAITQPPARGIDMSVLVLLPLGIWCWRDWKLIRHRPNPSSIAEAILGRWVALIVWSALTFSLFALFFFSSIFALTTMHFEPGLPWHIVFLPAAFTMWYHTSLKLFRLAAIHDKPRTLDGDYNAQEGMPQ